jgi:hypothetical protein
MKFESNPIRTKIPFPEAKEDPTSSKVKSNRKEYRSYSTDPNPSSISFPINPAFNHQSLPCSIPSKKYIIHEEYR